MASLITVAVLAKGFPLEKFMKFSGVLHFGQFVPKVFQMPVMSEQDRKDTDCLHTLPLLFTTRGQYSQTYPGCIVDK